MRTVTGEITSTKPIPLSKASKILAKFISTDNAASSAVSVYLSRTSESLNELAQLHKSKPKSKSDQKGIKKSELYVGEARDGNAGNFRENGGGFGEVRETKKGGEEKRVGENGDIFGEVGRGVVSEEFSRGSGGKKDKSEKDNEGSGRVRGALAVDGSSEALGKEEDKEGLGGVVVMGTGVGDGVEVNGLDEGLGKKNKRKGKDGSGGVVDNVAIDGSGEGSGKKHKKRQKEKEGLSGVVNSGNGVKGDVDADGSGKKKKKKKKGTDVSQDLERVESKKRKVEEVEEGGEFGGSEERRRKKKRKNKHSD